MNAIATGVSTGMTVLDARATFERRYGEFRTERSKLAADLRRELPHGHSTLSR
jgi:hypothetical protein